MFVLSERSLKALRGVHPSLVRIVNQAIKISEVDFVVTEGLRTFERQKELFAAGKSWTMKSRHLNGYAVDLMACGVKDNWDLAHYEKIAKAMKEAAKSINVPLEWGGDWKQRDAVHFELDRKVFK